MRYLIKVTEQYRCDTEEEAKELIENAKSNKMFTLVKYNNEVKITKVKGEVVDEWRRVTLTKQFTSEKDPDDNVYVKYGYSNDED